MDRPRVRVDQVPLPQRLSTVCQFREKESPRKRLRPTVTLACRGAMPSWMERDRKRTRMNVAVRIETSLQATPQGAERLERRSDVVNELVARDLGERVVKIDEETRSNIKFVAARNERDSTCTRSGSQQKNHDERITRRQETNHDGIVISRVPRRTR